MQMVRHQANRIAFCLFAKGAGLQCVNYFSGVIFVFK